jgi:hypothetical protein
MKKEKVDYAVFASSKDDERNLFGDFVWMKS